MRHYASLYGKLGALRDRFLNFSDLQKISESQTLQQAVSYLSSKSLVSIDSIAPRDVERQLREAFLSKLTSFMFYLPRSERDLFEFFLYKYDIYNLKILLALHFSQHDKEVADYIYRNTPLFKRYAFLIDRERFVDKDLLLAFKGTKIFPFLIHTYRNYKEKGDLFFLDTVLEDEYYQVLLEKISEDKDVGLAEVFKYVLFVHNIIWAIRMHFVYKLSKEEIYYYLVFPLPGINTREFLMLFDTNRVSDFRGKVESFLKHVQELSIDKLPDDIDGMKKIFFDSLLDYLWRMSKSIEPYSLKGLVAWVFAQEMLLNKLSFVLYEKFLEEPVLG